MEGFVVWAAVRLEGATKNLRGGRLQQAFTAGAVAGQSENKFNGSALLVSGQVGDGSGNGRSERLWFAGCAAAGEEERCCIQRDEKRDGFTPAQ